MQKQIFELNEIANSREYSVEVKEYCEALTKVLWAFQHANRVAKRVEVE